MGVRGFGKSGGGRKKGTPNKATADVRAAIALIAQRNVERVEEWLLEIKDPSRRMQLFLDMCEYHIPKLSRTVITGEGGGPVSVNIMRFTDATPGHAEPM